MCPFMPSSLYVFLSYYSFMGKKPNMSNPQTFQEKIQWLKIHYKRKDMHKLVDKYEVKKIVSQMIGDQYVIPTVGIYNNVEEIPFDILPKRFVVKSTHSSHSSWVCLDKDNFDWDVVKRQYREDSKTSPYYKYKEWAYKGVKPRLIIEQFMGVEGQELIDYKFYCFGGEPKYCQVITNRSSRETIDFYDNDWNHMPFIGLNKNAIYSNVPIARPTQLEIMLEISSNLSKDFPFARVDLYEILGKVYFGEITFYPGGGLGHFVPEKWEIILGEMIKLPRK